MIGEKIKIGFDGSEVKRGLAGIMGGFGKLGRGIGRATRQVGIGGARKMGSDLFGFVLSSLKAIPNELQGLSLLNKELDVMHQSTGVVKEDFLAMREAISKATGRDADEASDFMRDVSERIGEGLADINSTPKKAMLEMGIFHDDIAGKNIIEQMEVIARKFKAFKDEEGPEAAMFQINELLGEVGKQMIPLFLNYDEGMKNARVKTAGLAAQIADMGEELENVFDVKQSLSRKFSQLSLAVLKAFSEISDGGVGSISEAIENLPIDQWAKSIATEMKKIKDMGPFDWIMEKLDMLKDWLADAISQGIQDGVKNALPSFSIKGLLGIGGDKAPSKSGGLDFQRGNQWIMDKLGVGAADNAKIEQNTGKTNQLLERIATNGMTGVYA